VTGVIRAPTAGEKTVYDETFATRLAEADEFSDRITPRSLNEDERHVHHQALAGMLWTRQDHAGRKN
jgi:hypothetical protein